MKAESVTNEKMCQETLDCLVARIEEVFDGYRPAAQEQVLRAILDRIPEKQRQYLEEQGRGEQVDELLIAINDWPAEKIATLTRDIEKEMIAS